MSEYAFDFDLDEAIKTYPLPEDWDDVPMNQAQLAEAFQKSVNTIEKWRRAGMPVKEAGSNGKAYEYQPSECWAWFHAWKSAETARQQKADDTAKQMAQYFLNLGEDEAEEGLAGMSAADLAELHDRERYYNQTAEGRRARCSREDVHTMMGLVFQIVREHAETMPDRMERELGLSPPQVQGVVVINDEFLNSIKEAIERSPIYTYTGSQITTPYKTGDVAHATH